VDAAFMVYFVWFFPFLFTEPRLYAGRFVCYSRYESGMKNVVASSSKVGMGGGGKPSNNDGYDMTSDGIGYTKGLL